MIQFGSLLISPGEGKRECTGFPGDIESCRGFRIRINVNARSHSAGMDQLEAQQGLPALWGLMDPVTPSGGGAGPLYETSYQQRAY